MTTFSSIFLAQEISIVEPLFLRIEIYSTLRKKLFLSEIKEENLKRALKIGALFITADKKFVRKAKTVYLRSYLLSEAIKYILELQ